MSEQRTTVVVLERGAVWPSCLTDCRRDAPDTVVIAQDEDEHAWVLARRLEARVLRLRGEGRRIDAAVMAFGDRPLSREVRGPAHLGEARTRLARVLLAALDAAEGAAGTLWLTAPTEVAPATQHAIFAVAGALSTLLGASGTTIAVRFGTGPSAVPARSRSGFTRRTSAVAI